jgi:hypothetical protein
MNKNYLPDNIQEQEQVEFHPMKLQTLEQHLDVEAIHCSSSSSSTIKQHKQHNQMKQQFTSREFIDL